MKKTNLCILSSFLILLSTIFVSQSYSSDSPLFNDLSLFNKVSIGGPSGNEVWAIATSIEYIYNYEHYWIEKGTSKVKTFIDVSVSPDGKTIWAVAAGNKMWKYTRGKGWSKILERRNVSSFDKVSVGGPNGDEVWAIASSTKYIYKGKKKGINEYDWIEKSTSKVKTFIDVSVSPDGKTIWAVAVGNKMWKYTRGKGWFKISDSNKVPMFYKVSVGGPNGNEVWAIAASTNLIYQYVMKDNKKYDWIEKSTSKAGTFIDVSVSPDGKTIWAVAVGNKMWKYTSDKGWLPLSDNLEEVYSNPNKTPVIFIHGKGDSPRAWMKILEKLRKETDFMNKYNVLTFTYDDHWAINDIGSLLKNQIEARGIIRPIIVAHSMGGLVSRAYITIGGSVTKLITFASPHYGSSIQGCSWAPYPGWKDMCVNSDFLNALNSNYRDKSFRDQYAVWAGEKGTTTYDGTVNTQSAWLCDYLCGLDNCETEWRKQVETEGQLNNKCITDCPCDSSITERYYENISHTDFLNPDLNSTGYSYIAHLLNYKRTRNAAIKGHNRRKLTNVTPADCAKACDEETDFNCKSFDYHKYTKKCDLCDKQASDVGGLKTDYPNNPYDHYARETIKDNQDFFSRWMSNDNKIQNSSLNEITLPGAHDAGMGKTVSCTSFANDASTKTQDKSMLQMLNSGIRYFDIRPIINHDGKMYLGHYSWISELGLGNKGCLGYSVDEMLEDVKNFVSSSTPNKEVIILKMSHFMNLKKYDNENSHFDNNDFKQLRKAIIFKLGKYLVKGNTNFLNTPIKNLTKNGVKVIVTFDADGYDGSDGIYSQQYLNLFDEYSNTNDFDTMKKDQFEKMINNTSSKYFVLSWTLTLDAKQAINCAISGSRCTSIKNLADIANANVHVIPEESIKDKKYPNVIYADFVSSQLTEAAMLINKYR